MISKATVYAQVIFFLEFFFLQGPATHGYAYLDRKFQKLRSGVIAHSKCGSAMTYENFCFKCPMINKAAF